MYAHEHEKLIEHYNVCVSTIYVVSIIAIVIHPDNGLHKSNEDWREGTHILQQEKHVC